jgi:hypothetical protein
MRYQLVVQFAADGLVDFNNLIALEEILIARLAHRSETHVDGHDCGSGEFNIFIRTNDPRALLGEVSEIIQEAYPNMLFSAGYRSFDQDKYVVLWPTDLERFCIA